MSDDQIPFDHPELVANPEPRCACLLLLDTSGSMSGQPIAELNAGLVTLKDESMADPMSTQRVEIALVSFGPVRVHSDFQSPDTWTPPHLRPTGDTPMGAAIEHGLVMLEARNRSIARVGSPTTAPGSFSLPMAVPLIAGEMPRPSSTQGTAMSGRVSRFSLWASKAQTWKSSARSAAGNR